MKKKFLALALSALMVTGLVGCGSNSDSGNSSETTLKVGMVTDSGTIDDKSFNQGTWDGIKKAEKELGVEKNYMQPNSSETTLKVGMVTDSGTIDDKSFNQGTWDGIKKAEKELGVEKNYMQPSGETEANYLTEIQNLYDAGFKFIVTPGYKFETAIYKAQEQYKDAKFVILDGAPHNKVHGTELKKLKKNLGLKRIICNHQEKQKLII